MESAQFLEKEGAMKTFLQTKEGVRRKIQDVTAWIASALVGTGVALVMTVMFAGAGIALLLLGLAVLAFGQAASLVFPAFLRYEPRMCPHCRAVNQVYYKASAFSCSRCSQRVAIGEMAKVY